MRSAIDRAVLRRLFWLSALCLPLFVGASGNVSAGRTQAQPPAALSAIDPCAAPQHGHAPDPRCVGRLAAETDTGEACWPAELPLGALPPAKPVWCSALASGPGTALEAANSWVDDFDHGLMHGEVGEGYRISEGGGGAVYRTKHFRHNNHWMVDVAGHDRDGGPPWNLGGATMSPARSFRFEDGRLVIEADVAAGITAYDGNAWPEIIVSTAPAPTGTVVDPLYGYGAFGGAWTLGCRLQASRIPICAMYAPDGQRPFEIAFWLAEGAQVTGGGPWDGGQLAWRECRDSDPDLHCRDRFRLELTQDTVTLYVNGFKYMEHRGLPPDKQLPPALLNGDVYVHFASWVYKPQADTIRFHWDRVAVNPGTPPSSVGPMQVALPNLALP